MNRTLIPIAALALAAPLLADYIEILTPDVTASAHDEPIDGSGDSVDTFAAPGRIQLSPTSEDRAFQEFDVSAVDTFDASAAWFKGRITATDATDVGLRTFEFTVYDADGVAHASDFEIAGVVIGTAQYHPPSDPHVDFYLDASGAVLTLLNSGASDIGLRVRCTSGSSPGDELSSPFAGLEIEHCLFGLSGSFCFGHDGNCPGGAAGAPGHGCPHGAGPDGADGALLTPSGNAQFSDDSFGFYLSSGPSSLGLLIQGASPINYPFGNPNVPNSAGLFCVTPSLRGNVELMNLGLGSDEAAIDDFQGQPFGATAQPAGSSTYYQFWFRDTGNPNANPAPGAEFNFSNAVEVAWID